jgi:hypothetical protein
MGPKTLWVSADSARALKNGAHGYRIGQAAD